MAGEDRNAPRGLKWLEALRLTFISFPETIIFSREERRKDFRTNRSETG